MASKNDIPSVFKPETYRSKNRMLTGYVFNIETDIGEEEPLFSQRIIYAKSIEFAERYISRIYNDPSHSVVYEGFFFQ